MDLLSPPLLTAGLAIFLFLALCASLALAVVTLRAPATTPLAVAAGLVIVATLVVAIAPVNIPSLMGLILGLLALAVSVLGGNPITRRVLDLATGDRVRETADGGIVLRSRTGDVEGDENQADDESDAPKPVMRGGTTIGYLERVAVTLAIIAGFPEAIAVVVAIKGIGRFSELGRAEARERFIIGTLASLVWACVIGALVRLAIW